MYGGKFGGNFIPETLKKPIDDLTKLFARLRKDKKFLKEDHFFTTHVGAPTPFIKLENLSDHLGGAQIWQKLYLKQMVELTKSITPLFIVLSRKKRVKNILLVIQVQDMQGRCFQWLQKIWSQM